jgi:predicted AAA+ superfamily ATPase
MVSPDSDDQIIRKTLEFYNPWWKNKNSSLNAPLFRRFVYDDIFTSVTSLRQIVSITGPRRVGKTTIIKQLISDLIVIENVSPSNLVYLSMDDPYIFSKRGDPIFFDKIISIYEKYYLLKKIKNGDTQFNDKEKVYFLIDEIHKFSNWELFLKKYYDKGYNIKFIISGSVSSSIVSKSKESLAGRIKNFKIYPFSFSEFVSFKVSFDDTLDIQVKEEISKNLVSIQKLGESVFTMPTAKIFDEFDKISRGFGLFSDELYLFFEQYLIIGGFIEGWEIQDTTLQYEYLYQTQIEKVLLEDIYILEDIKNTSSLANLFFLFASKPSEEYSLNELVRETGLHRETLERYISLLRESNLILTLSKYGSNINKVSSVKVFLIDMGIRNSILKIKLEEILSNPDLFNKYLENIILLSLLQKSEAVAIEYFREREKEVDFILSYSDLSVGINVQYTKNFLNLSKKFEFSKKIILTKDFEPILKDGVLYIPYILFLLAL